MRMFIIDPSKAAKRIEHFSNILEKNKVSERKLNDYHEYRGRALFLRKNSIKKKIYRQQVDRIMEKFERTKAEGIKPVNVNMFIPKNKKR